MKSPFPGMDPYLERHWRDVHQRLTVYACDALQAQLPDDLLARIEERVFLETEGDRIRSIALDVRVSEVYPESERPPSALREGGSPVAEPIEFEIEEIEVVEGYIEIREGENGKVLTVIEFLSPANKRAGTGQQKYLEKQAEVLQSDASLAEIDLIRAGRRVLALPAEEIPVPHRNDYLACVSPGWKRRRRLLYPIPLRRRLPILPIPLRRYETPVKLDLQGVVDQAYAAGRYHKMDYDAELDPPLPPEETAWVAELLKGQG